MKDVLDKQLARFEELERQMADPAVQTNGPMIAAVARERGTLAKVATKYRRFKDLNQQIAETNVMIAGGDSELRELAEAELPVLKQEREALWDELLDIGSWTKAKELGKVRIEGKDYHPSDGDVMEFRFNV